jgi:hypothetical protein
VAFGGQNEQPAGVLHRLLIGGVLGLDLGADRLGVAFGVGGDGLHDLELDIAAQFDVGAAPGHVGGDGDRAQLARIGDDLRLLLVLARVQDVVGQARLLQQPG